MTKPTQAAYDAAAVAVHDRECPDSALCTGTPTSMTRYAELGRVVVDAVWHLARAQAVAEIAEGAPSQ